MKKPTPVRVLDPANTRMILVGAGGTGGYALQQLCRLLYGLREQRRRERDAPTLGEFGGSPPEGVPPVVLADGDAVSTANLLRQYFLPVDVGRNKALVLAERYGAAYGLEISAYSKYLSSVEALRQLAPEGSLVVGCVDNSAARRLLHEGLSSYQDVVYVDAGNAAVASQEGGVPASRRERVRARDSGWEGQVMCGVRRCGETVVPMPAEQVPDLIEDDGEPAPGDVPCGQVVVSDPQRHLTNLWAATVLASFLTPLISEGVLLHRMSLFCARRGYVASYPALEVLDEVSV